MSTKSSAIKIIAKEAKQRLKMMRYDNHVSNCRSSSLSQEESVLYQKVVKMMESDRVVTNPISALMDNEYYNKLSSDGKQRYILYLSDKFIKLKAFYNSHNEERVS